ncbi:murein L,D-transpeptidase [Flavobacterium alvei]|uniref:L,D-transpeptidase family protein n=1 Tax=Flavobacterium alvei TaxID=2080416 RepID=UPI0026EEFA94|nr:L,D-transpeptidase family protein [Flavobacterium alvei]
MNKLLILLLVFTVLSCEKESKKKPVTPVPVARPKIVVEGKSVVIDSALLNSYDSKVLKEFYLATGFKSVWQSNKERRIILEQLLKSDEEGLNPANYNVIKLQKFEKKYANLNDENRANYDVLFTRSLQKYISHLTSGRFNPSYLYKNWDLKKNSIDVNQTIALLLKTDSLAFKMEELKPNHIVYKSLKKALQIINSFPNDDFTTIEIANKIVLNDTNPSLIAIKKRLIYWKDMKPKDSLSAIYDSETNEAMKKFQIRHGLSADGVIGKGTVDALNFSKRKRKEQILANLERWKWFPREMGEEYVIVNIPDYKLSLVKENDTLRTHKVVVGRDKRPTPVLSSKINQIILNPTWTVPPTILKEDMIPAISRNRNYLAQTNIKVYDSSGNLVSANDWNPSKAKKYRYVQSPGKSNSLGMVKINFPNRFSVYLHDTNHRDFFVKQKRSLSSGCVRVENPLKLAETLLNDADNWNTEKITKILQSEKTKYIKMNDDVKVHILYWTAWSEGNTLIFRDDIYNLDADLYQML